MKRFLLLTDDMGQGGAERQLAYLAVELKKAGHHVRLIKFYPGENFYGSELGKYGIETEVIEKGRSSFKRPMVINRLVKDWQPDTVICYKDGTAMAGCIARMFRKFNLIVSERNTTQSVTRKEKLKFWLYRFANHIVPNSYSQNRFIEGNFPTLNKKLSVITNMIDIDKFSPATEKVQNDYPNIVTAARVSPQKNVLTYLDAIAEIKRRGIRVHFDWHGRFEHPDYHEEIKEKIRKLGIEDYVTFHGPTKDVVSVYRKSDIFLLPSLYEGFPNVLCEAMACGLPAIATNVCDSPVILKDERFLPSPLSPKKIADSIEEMLFLSANERRDLGEQNRETIIGLCSKDTFVNKYCALE